MVAHRAGAYNAGAVDPKNCCAASVEFAMKPVLVLRHVPFEEIGSLADYLAAAGLAVDQVDCFGPGWPLLVQAGFDPARLAGLIVMGGPMNVDQTDDYPFLATEREWLRAAVSAGLPTLGVCLGAQMLARSLGAAVRPNPVKEIGWYEVEALAAAADDPLFAGCQLHETVFQWHGDTFDLPPGGVHLVRGATCHHQAFRVGLAAWGLQFHLEITAAMIADWLAEPEMCCEIEPLEYIDPAEIRRRTPDGLAAMAPLTRRVFGRFAALCYERASATR